MMNNKARAPRRIDPALWIFMIYLAAAVILYRLSPTITGALILGLYLSMIIMVPARYISKVKFISEKASLVISALFVFTVMIVTIYQVFPIVIEEAGKLFKTLTEENVSISSLIGGMPPFFQDIMRNDSIMKILEEQLSKIVSAFSSYGMNLLNTTIHTIPNALTSLVIFLIAAVYLSSLKPVFRDNLWRFFPKSTRRKSIAFVHDYYASIKSFISGQLIIALVVGLIVGFGMSLAGIPYGVFLGFLAGVTNFIPFFGVIITAVPAIFLGLVNYGLWGLLRVGIVLVLANQIESWVLSPKIQGDRMELNWFVILLGILLFGGLFGIIGVLFAVPIMVFIKNFWTVYVQAAFRRL